MDRSQKMSLRSAIGEHINVSGARLTDEEAIFLWNFIKNYGNYRGRSQTRSSSYTGWSSDGKYTRWETYTDTFTERVGIRHDYSYHDDDGQSGKHTEMITDARGILRWFENHRWPSGSVGVHTPEEFMEQEPPQTS